MVNIFFQSTKKNFQSTKINYFFTEEFTRFYHQNLSREIPQKKHPHKSEAFAFSQIPHTQPHAFGIEHGLTRAPPPKPKGRSNWNGLLKKYLEL